MKTLNQHYLGEEIQKENAEAYFGKKFCELFTFPLRLVGITFTVQDKDETQMDYQLKHKSFIEKEDSK